MGADILGGILFGCDMVVCCSLPAQYNLLPNAFKTSIYAYLNCLYSKLSSNVITSLPVGAFNNLKSLITL